MKRKIKIEGEKPTVAGLCGSFAAVGRGGEGFLGRHQAAGGAAVENSRATQQAPGGGFPSIQNLKVTVVFFFLLIF